MLDAEISVSKLLSKASQETGLNDFGAGEFIEAFNRFVESAASEGHLSLGGRHAFLADTHRLLVNRLRFTNDVKRHPEILEEDVSDPIIILGLPRTGTTKLQRTIAADPGVQRLEHWRLSNPGLFPHSDKDSEDPRIAVSRATFQAMDAGMLSAMMESHYSATHEVDEDVFLQAMTFKCVLTYLSRPMPSFRAWMQTQSLQGTYEYTRDLLKYLQWQDGGKRGRPWVLKSPVHLSATDLLADLYPAATFVFTHRALPRVIASECRLEELSHRLYVESLDLHAFGRTVLDHWSSAMTEHLRQRETLEARVSIYDVSFEMIRDDIFGVIDSIYKRRGAGLSAEQRRAMIQWDKSNPHEKLGSYDLATYGLSPERVNSAFADYLTAFRHLAQ